MYNRERFTSGNLHVNDEDEDDLIFDLVVEILKYVSRSQVNLKIKVDSLILIQRSSIKNLERVS